MARRHLRILAVTVASGLSFVLGACGETESTPEPVVMGPAVVHADPVLDPEAGAPEVGSCHRLSSALIAQPIDRMPPVDCTQKHTTVTYLVDQLPDQSKVSEETVIRRRCERAFPEAAGIAAAERDGTMLTWTWFAPSGDQRARGARWFRCDVHLRPEVRGKARNLTGSGVPILDGTIPEHLRRCVRVDAANPADAAYVTCDQPHDYRWVGGSDVQAPGYPDAEGWRTMADARCRPLVGNDAFWFTYPPAPEWKQGNHRLSCFRATA